MDQASSIAEPPVADAADPASKSLWTNTCWTLVGNVVYAACQSGWLVLISKLSSPESRGRFVLAMAIATPIIAFANFGLRAMLATDVRGEHRFLRYVALRSFCMFVAFLIIAGIALTQHVAAAWMLVVVGAFKSIELISDILWGRMQQFERFDRIARSQVIKGISSVSLLAIGLILTHDALGAAMGIAVGFLATLLLFDIPTAWSVAGQLPQSSRAMAARLSAELRGGAVQLRKFIWQAAPLAFASSLILLNGNLVIYFIRWSFVAEKAEPMIGVFGAFSYLVQVGMILVAAIGVATATRLATYYGDGNLREFHWLVLRLLVLCAALGAAGVVVALVAGKPLIALLFKPEDAQHVDVLVWLMLSGAVSYLASILGYAVTATRRFHRFTLPYLCVTVVGIIASALLIPKFELTGAAWASGIINLACCLAPTFILLRLHFESAYEPATRAIG